jgi:hypothetical protein
MNNQCCWWKDPDQQEKVVGGITTWLDCRQPDKTRYEHPELWMRIRIRKFLDLPSTSKNPWFMLFSDFLMTFFFEDWCKKYLQKIISKKIWKKKFFLMGSWKSLTKRAGSGSAAGSGSVIKCTDPRIWIQIKCYRSGTMHCLHTVPYAYIKA